MKGFNKKHIALVTVAILLWLYGAANAVWAQTEPVSSTASSADASSSAAAEKPLYASADERNNALLQKAFAAVAKAEEIQWLETPDEKFITLYKTSEAHKTKGVLVILHAPETPPHWPVQLENLRRNLPYYGWSTLAVPMPSKYPSPLPPRDNASSGANNSGVASSSDLASASSESASSAPASSAAASSEPAKPQKPRPEVISARVEAAINHLNKNGQYNLVLLVDNSCAPDALEGIYKKINKATTTSDTIDGAIQALILINLQAQESLTKAQLGAVFAVGEMPIMDVFVNDDNKVQAAEKRQHRAEAMRQNIKDYQQYTLLPEPVVALDDTQNFWLGKIHGFMEIKAEGSEMSKKNNATPDAPASTEVEMK